MHSVFSELAILLMIAAAAGAISLWLRQPLLIAYIAIGLIAGPSMLGLVTAHEQIDLFAQIGVAVLLFIVGLKLDLQHIRHIGPVALATGLGQLTFTIVFGFVLILLLGKTMMEALYVSVALTFSSTIIIVKLLSDKREIDSLHGRIAVGFLIVQDLAVVLAMMAMSAMRSDGDAAVQDVLLSLAWRVSVAAVVIYVLMRYILPKWVTLIAKSQELLLIFAIAWGTGFAAIGEMIGFSKEAGAFLAGFTLASTVYRDAIHARLSGIRDFLLLFFFVDLGAKLDLSTLGAEIWPAIALSVFVLIGNPLIVMAIMGYMGYRKRTGFLAGLTVAQISEFSIIFVAMGISIGHVGVEALSLTTLVGIVTITLSTYMILFSHPLYEKLSPWMGWFERRKPFREMAVESGKVVQKHADVIVFGMGRYGAGLASGLKKAGLSVIGVDFDPETIRSMKRQGLPVYYGDCTSLEFLETLPLNGAAWVVSALPDIASNTSLLDALKQHEFQGEVAIIAREGVEQKLYCSTKPVTVIYPMQNAVHYTVESIYNLVQENKKETAA
ncbi:MAG: sodium:proton exchanger [Betaproteobacteria bacterium HGW-Betaproteobacteria-22]|nr:MAG: sodium:proton exchanger [Betaproteobacteria bacterium HGW-Betaproteobacteria-22]